MDKKPKKMVPEVRFKGFTDDWEQRKFSNVFKKSKEKNDLSYSKSQVISVANMTWSNAPETSTNKYMKTYNVVHLGDIVFEGHKNKMNQFGRFVENTIGDGIVSHIFDVYKPKTLKYHDLNFWKYYINSEKVMRNTLRMSTTSARMMHNLVSKDISKQLIKVPSFEETKKIGSLINKIDRFISLQQKKLEQLKLLKKAMLQQLFVSDKNNLVPNIRFSGFNSSWKQRKFETLLLPKNGIRRGPFGSALRKDSFVPKSEESYAVYEQRNAIYNKFDVRYYISSQKYNQLSNFHLHTNDVIMSGAGTIGKLAKVPLSFKKGVYNQALIRFQVNKGIDVNYFLFFMKTPQMQKQLTEANPGSAMVNLVPMKELKKWDVIIPSKDEQIKIASLIIKVDRLLSLQQSKINQLLALKKYMLQKLFI
ncbi:MAG TPA: restriction endonuclease subunit S [Limosilactobacillus coleohominis]|nr:restriction endonuclease subunit S [Limosilactobacillus coleohominis]